jgi:hypothetical protein
MVVYSRATEDASSNLEFLLKRSIAMKEQQMAKKVKETTTERASVSRERRLTLALVALIDANRDTGNSEIVGAEEAQAKAEQDAVNILSALGYSNLEGIPKRVARLNEQLTAAVAAGDGKEISRLGIELERAKLGKAPLSVNGTAAVKE